MKIIFGSDSKIRSSAGDIMCDFLIADNDMALPRVMIPDFVAEFYIENRSATKVTCSFLAGVYTLCSIDTDGKITCCLPKNTFFQGRLFMRIQTITPDGRFPDNTFEAPMLYDTEIRVVYE